MMVFLRKVRFAALLSVCSVAACCSQLPYDRPGNLVPEQFPDTEVGKPTRPDTSALTLNQFITDPRLRSIVDRALANNQEVREALANIDAARALYRIERASIFPEVDGEISYTRRQGGSAPANNAAGSGGEAIAGSGRSRDQYAVQAGAPAFEVDLFGRLRSLREAALNRYLARADTAHAIKLLLVSDIVQAWLTYAADHDRLALALDTQLSAQKSVSLTRALVERGVVPRTDVRQAETILAGARADAARLRSVISQDANALNLLAGETVDRSLLPTAMADAANATSEIQPGISSELLLHRPDVMAAEFEIKAADGDVGAARAALFPTISLTGIAGVVSNALSNIVSGAGLFSNIGASAQYPIFNAGAGRANLGYARAVRDAAVARYGQTLQIAFREAADAIARQATLAEEMDARQLAVDASSDSYRLSTARYKAGLDPYLSNLDAQRTLYQARRDMISLQLTSGINRSELFKALGGEA